MTTVTEDGVTISASYLAPKTKQELLLKRTNTEIWSHYTLGCIGRFPDFCANLIVGLRNAAPDLALEDQQYSINAINYHNYCMKNDLALTHALNDQFFDRTKNANEQLDKDLILHVVKETDTGIIVRGLKNLATLSPICDEVLVYPNRPRKEGEEDQSLAFAIPMNAQGLNIICREPYGRQKNTKVSPISTRFDEMDATLIFNDVLVPWERVFSYRNPSLTSRFIGLINPPWSGYVTLIRLVSKLEIVIGLVDLLSEWDGKHVFPQIQVRIGQLVRDVNVLKACIRATEEDTTMTEAGFLKPASSDAYRLFGVEASDRADMIMEDILASALIPTGTELDFEIPVVGEFVERFFKGLAPSSKMQMRLMSIASDMTQSSFGSRTQLYERFHMGSPDMVFQRIYHNQEKNEWRDRILKFAENI